MHMRAGYIFAGHAAPLIIRGNSSSVILSPLGLAAMGERSLVKALGQKVECDC